MVRSLLSGLATVVALPRAAQAARRGIRRASAKIAVTAAAGMLVLAGGGFLLAALVLTLAAEFGIRNATLIVGGGLVALGIAVLLAAKFAGARPHRFRAVAHAEASFATAPDDSATADGIETRLAEAAAKHTVALATAALAVGIAAGFLGGRPKAD